MRNLKILFTIIVSAVILFACNQDKKSTDKTEVIKIGAILPLTGNIAYFGEYETRALKVAEKLFNNPDSTFQYELIYEDSKNDPKTAILAMNKLIQIDKVDFILTQMSGVSMSLAPIAKSNKIPLISLAMHPDFPQSSEYSYRVYESISQEGKVLGDYLIDSNVDNISVVSIEDVWGEAAYESFKDNFEKRGGKIVSYDRISYSQSDYKTTIMKILGKNPKGIYLAAYGPLVNQFAKQLREIDADIALYGNIGMSWTNILASGHEWLNNSIMVMPNFMATNNSQIDFVKKYNELFEDDPNFESSYTFDCFLLINKATRLSNRDEISLQDALSKIKKFDGVNGKIYIDEYGDSQTDTIAIRQFVNRELVTLLKYGI